MSLIHDKIKIDMVRKGYLPNYPYHLISDAEMFDAFLHKETTGDGENYWYGSFTEIYPNISDNLDNEYESLKNEILYHIEQYFTYPNKYKGKVIYRYELPTVDELKTLFGENNIDGVIYSVESENIRVEWNVAKNGWDDTYSDGKIPDWVYSYMLGSTIGPLSDIQDIQDLMKLMNIEYSNEAFDAYLSSCCLEISKKWTSKLSGKQADHRPPTMFGEPHVIKQLRILQSNISSK